MKAVWAQDYDFMTHGGGAQLTDRSHYVEGLKRGHKLSIWSPGSGIGAGDISGLVIASNPVFLGVEVFDELSSKRVPYIWLLHDYWPMCKYRLFFPMIEKCMTCYLKERWIPVLLRSKLIVWLSPLHRESWLAIAPELKDMPYHLAPSPINEDLFNDRGIGSRHGAVAVESLAEFKGRAYVLKWAEEHSEVDLDFVGENPIPGEALPSNCRVLGPIPYWRMPDVYNDHEFFVHLPQSPSPFDRSVAEAYLCGCSIIGNTLIGALSYPWFRSRDEVAKRCGGSPGEFWDAVERVAI